MEAAFKCPHCSEAYVRRAGLLHHLQSEHGGADSPSPVAIVADMGDTPSDVYDVEHLRYALWQAYLSLRFSSIHLQYEDIRMLDQLASLAATWRGP